MSPRSTFTAACLLTLAAAGSALAPTTAAAPPQEPTIEYASLEAVRDSVLALLHRAIAPGDTTIRVGSDRAQFEYRYSGGSASGYAINVAVTGDSPCLTDYLANELDARGWEQALGYSADGPDGTVMGYVTTRFLCVIEGRWDGGDDADSLYVPVPGCEMTVTCVARREDDEPR